MLYWAAVFFVLALVAAVLGFGGFVTGSLIWAAKVCFILFVVLFVVSLFRGGAWGPPAEPY